MVEAVLRFTAPVGVGDKKSVELTLSGSVADIVRLSVETFGLPGSALSETPSHVIVTASQKWVEAVETFDSGVGNSDALSAVLTEFPEGGVVHGQTGRPIAEQPTPVEVGTHKHQAYVDHMLRATTSQELADLGRQYAKLSDLDGDLMTQIREKYQKLFTAEQGK